MRQIIITEDFKVKDNWTEEGTSYQDDLVISFDDIVRVFGKPNGQNDYYKIDAEWEIITPAGIATIHNYKDGKNYLGPNGKSLNEITKWYIGGHSKKVVKYIKRVLLASEVFLTSSRV